MEKINETLLSFSDNWILPISKLLELSMKLLTVDFQSIILVT